MRRLLALAALGTATAPAAPAHAAYTCVPEDSAVGACVQVTECTDPCYFRPGVRFECYLGFRGETVCRVVRALGFEVAGR